MATDSSNSSTSTNSSPSSNPALIEELTFTLGELNKALDNVQYMAVLAKELDLASLLKKASKSKWKELLKNIDLKQVQSFLESPLVQQIIEDPELLNMFLPQATQEQKEASAPFPNQSGASSPNNPFSSAAPPATIPSNPYTPPSQQVSLRSPYATYPTRYVTRQPTRVLAHQRPYRSALTSSSSAHRNPRRKPDL